MYVMIALRVMGKREIGQLSVFDFVVSVMIAELSTLSMEETSVPLWRSLVAIAALVVLQIIVALISMKSHSFRHLVEGEPAVLIEHGQIRDKEMRRSRYTMHDLLMELRQKGFASVNDVEFAILETSGKLSVFPKPEKRPATPEDLRIAVNHSTIPMPLVVDGQPVSKTLRILKRDENWLRQELGKRGYDRLEDVFYAAIDESGTLFIDPQDEIDTYHDAEERRQS
ncbi:MAG: DUF421 domain-containing protein [Thermoflavifilum sp.]|nr:DUF421 domain-containing protein [Thermoflavifilum sp.]MCL6512839.1 DUF421 domain-containing protein [Alicyclobacillus sp.]